MPGSSASAKNLRQSSKSGGAFAKTLPPELLKHRSATRGGGRVNKYSPNTALTEIATPSFVGGRGFVNSPTAAKMLQQLKENPFPEGYDPNKKRPQTMSNLRKSKSLGAFDFPRARTSYGPKPQSQDRSTFLISRVKNGQVTVGIPAAQFAGMSNMSVENAGHRSHKKKPKKGGLITFGSASRFVNEDLRSGPGPKYHPYDSFPDALIQEGPAFGFGTGKPDRTGFMSTVIRNDVLLTQANADSESNNMGPAAYHPGQDHVKEQHPRVVWGKSKDIRFKKLSKHVTTPGPKYFTKLKGGTGVTLGPKPDATDMENAARYKLEDEARLKNQRIGKFKEQLALEETMRDSTQQETSPTAKGAKKAFARSTTWARRLPSSIYQGKKLALYGQSSPGPAYALPGHPYAEKPPPQYIPYPKGWHT